MHSSAPWSGVQQPWSFTFNPDPKAGRPVEDVKEKKIVPEQPSGQKRETAESGQASSSSTVAEMAPRKMYESYVEASLSRSARVSRGVSLQNADRLFGPAAGRATSSQLA